MKGSHKRIQPQILIGFCAALAALCLLIAQHLGMMLSNSDDPWISLASKVEIVQTASQQGRFWLIPVMTLAHIPYSFGSWEIANVIKMATNALVFLSFVWFCTRLTNRVNGLLIGLVWLALVDLSPGEYSPFHGFLWMFNLQFVALFISFTLYLKALDVVQTKKTIVLPFVFYGFALLAYEPMLFYALVFPALFLYRGLRGQEFLALSMTQWIGFTKLFVRRNCWLAIVVVIYLILFFGYRAAQPHSVRGIEVSGSWWTILKTTYLFSIHGLHLEINPLANYVTAILPQFQVMLALLYGIVITLACFFLLPKMRLKLLPTTWFSPVVLGMLVFFVLSPNILLALTAGYQKWAEFDPHYVGSYFSSFPLAILATLLILYLVGGEKSKGERILFVAILFMLFSSAADNYVRWAQLATEHRRGAALWAQAVSHLQTNRIALESKTGIPLVICGTKLPLKVKGDDVYWGRYLTEKLGQKVLFFGKPSPNQECTINLDFDRFRYPSKK